MAIAGICWDFFFCGVRAKNDFWVGKITFLKRLLGFAGISPFFALPTATWQTARKKIDFWVGEIIFLKLESGDCWDLLGFLLLRVDCCLAGCPEKK